MKRGGYRLSPHCLLSLSVLALGIAMAAIECRLPSGGLLAAAVRATRVLGEEPRVFGAFHLAALAICFSLAAAVLILADRLPDVYLDRVVFAVGVVLGLMEIYKQLYYHVLLGNGHYNFAILPLQFCSYAMYLFLLIPLLPQSKGKEMLYAFCAFYQTMGGCIVMVYPVLYAELPLSIHTMLWHTLMIATGLLIGRKRGYGRAYVREMLLPTAFFVGTVAMASVLNVLLAPLAKNSPGALNLFYMSPYIPTHYLLIGDVWEAFGWLPAVLCYILLFVFVGATLLWAVFYLARQIEKTRRNKIRITK